MRSGQKNNIISQTMAVKIRLQRFGKRDNPFFRIAAIEESHKRNGRTLEVLGNYDPKKKKLSIDQKKLSIWLNNGSIASEAVKKLLSL